MSHHQSSEAEVISIANFHFEQARLAAKQNNQELFKQHAIAAIHQAPEKWKLFEILGGALFELGELNHAFLALQKAAKNNTLNSLGAKILAALFRKAGQKKEARHYMSQFAHLSGIESPIEPNPKLTNVLRIRSAEKSHFGIKKNQSTGLLYCQLSGGHFSTTHLIKSKDFNLYQATSSENSLENLKTKIQFSALLNSISCPDLDEKGLRQAEKFFNQFPHLPAINHPSLVLHTTREENSKRLSNIPNVNMPRAELFEINKDLECLVKNIETAGFSYPFIARVKGTQTGKSVALINNQAELKDWAKAQPSPSMAYIIDYIDCRTESGFYKKTRIFFIDGQLYPVAHLTSDQWQIHSNDRYRVMDKTELFQKEEAQFLSNPEKTIGEKAVLALHAINDIIGLDFFGIDFSLDKNNNVVIFEANAAMRHNFDHAENFPYTRFHLERVSAAFTSMIKRKIRESQTDIKARPKLEPQRNLIYINEIAPQGGIKMTHYFDSIAQTLIKKILNPPHWVVLRSEHNLLRLEEIMRILFAMGMLERPIHLPPPKLSTTRIEINPKSHANASNITTFSRTSKALPLHTDCSNQSEPLNLVAFAMESPDKEGGGKNTLLTAADLARELSDDLANQLMEPRYDFGGGAPFSILNDNKGDWKIRYYRNQINCQPQANKALKSNENILNLLDQHLIQSTSVKQFSLAAGDILLIDNRRVLHGRTAMHQTSQRLMHRFRLHVPVLDQ